MLCFLSIWYRHQTTLSCFFKVIRWVSHWFDIYICCLFICFLDWNLMQFSRIHRASVYLWYLFIVGEWQQLFIYCLSAFVKKIYDLGNSICDQSFYKKIILYWPCHFNFQISLRVILGSSFSLLLHLEFQREGPILSLGLY